MLQDNKVPSFSVYVAPVDTDDVTLLDPDAALVTALGETKLVRLDITAAVSASPAPSHAPGSFRLTTL